MKTLELIGENFENQNQLEEIGNRFYAGVMELYEEIMDEISGIYNTLMAYGNKDGSGKGRRREGGGGRNANKEPCKGDGPGYGKGSGKGSGRRRK
jgi:hypothetical protein